MVINVQENSSCRTIRKKKKILKFVETPTPCDCVEYHHIAMSPRHTSTTTTITITTTTVSPPFGVFLFSSLLLTFISLFWQLRLPPSRVGRGGQPTTGKLTTNHHTITSPWSPSRQWWRMTWMTNDADDRYDKDDEHNGYDRGSRHIICVSSPRYVFSFFFFHFCFTNVFYLTRLCVRNGNHNNLNNKRSSPRYVFFSYLQLYY